MYDSCVAYAWILLHCGVLIICCLKLNILISLLNFSETLLLQKKKSCNVIMFLMPSSSHIRQSYIYHVTKYDQKRKWYSFLNVSKLRSRTSNIDHPSRGRHHRISWTSNPFPRKSSSNRKSLSRICNEIYLKQVSSGKYRNVVSFSPRVQDCIY